MRFWISSGRNITTIRVLLWIIIGGSIVSFLYKIWRDFMKLQSSLKGKKLRLEKVVRVDVKGPNWKSKAWGIWPKKVASKCGPLGGPCWTVRILGQEPSPLGVRWSKKGIRIISRESLVARLIRIVWRKREAVIKLYYLSQWSNECLLVPVW